MKPLIVTNLTRHAIVVNGLKVTIPQPDIDGPPPSVIVDATEGVHKELLELNSLKFVSLQWAGLVQPAAAKSNQLAPTAPGNKPSKAPKTKKAKASKSAATIATGRGKTIRQDFVPSLADAATANLPPGHPAHKALAEPPVPENQQEYSNAFIDVGTTEPINKPRPAPGTLGNVKS